MGGLWAVEGMEGNTRSTLNLLRCEPGLRRAWQLQAVLRLVTQPQDGTRPPPGEVGARGASAPRTATGAESGIVSSRTGWWRPPPSVMAAGKTTSLARVVPSSMRIVRTVYAEGQPQRELQRKMVRCFEDFFFLPSTFCPAWSLFCQYVSQSLWENVRLSSFGTENKILRQRMKRQNQIG